MTHLETCFDDLLGRIGRLGPDELEAALRGSVHDLGMTLIDESSDEDTQWLARLDDGDRRLELAYFSASYPDCAGQAAAIRIMQGEEIIAVRSWDFPLSLASSLNH